MVFILLQSLWTDGCLCTLREQADQRVWYRYQIRDRFCHQGHHQLQRVPTTHRQILRFFDSLIVHHVFLRLISRFWISHLYMYCDTF